MALQFWHKSRSYKAIRLSLFSLRHLQCLPFCFILHFDVFGIWIWATREYFTAQEQNKRASLYCGMRANVIAKVCSQVACIGHHFLIGNPNTRGGTFVVCLNLWQRISFEYETHSHNSQVFLCRSSNLLLERFEVRKLYVSYSLPKPTGWKYTNLNSGNLMRTTQAHSKALPHQPFDFQRLQNHLLCCFYMLKDM